MKSNHRGLYGDTQVYHGTVEQQGRLTLHIHLLLWIKGSITPKEMRERILDPDSNFQQHFVQWLESCFAREYLNGTQEEVISQIELNANLPEYKNPTETMPSPPPPLCNVSDSHILSECKACVTSSTWQEYFRQIVDDLLLKSNIHKCNRNKNKDGSVNKKHVYTGRMDNKWGKCKARFPWALSNETKVDKETGSLDMKKKESWLNTFTPALTYIFCCNTDVTYLMSGTAMKSVILYVSDYITKAPLKTHVIFESIKSIFIKTWS
ncbi:hypothetical protein L208DRAFT_1249601 [Tricholoma matsutake]|nr:hypothetical protein L208DRAFT_1249601 [Tricholoma matsutake 945]